jgi:hypothetical protein
MDLEEHGGEQPKRETPDEEGIIATSRRETGDRQRKATG